jgi:hypothetical protein
MFRITFKTINHLVLIKHPLIYQSRQLIVFGKITEVLKYYFQICFTTSFAILNSHITCCNPSQESAPERGVTELKKLNIFGSSFSILQTLVRKHNTKH